MSGAVQLSDKQVRQWRVVGEQLGITVWEARVGLDGPTTALHGPVWFVCVVATVQDRACPRVPAAERFRRRVQGHADGLLAALEAAHALAGREGVCSVLADVVW